LIFVVKYIFVIYLLNFIYCLIHEIEHIGELVLIKLVITPLFMPTFYVIYKNRDRNLIFYIFKYISFIIIRLIIISIFIILIFKYGSFNFNAILGGSLSLYIYLLGIEVFTLLKEH